MQQVDKQMAISEQQLDKHVHAKTISGLLLNSSP
jgi:hypothetical protein